MEIKIRRAAMEDFEGLKKIKLLSKKEEFRYSGAIRLIEDNKEDYFNYLKKDIKYINRGLFIVVKGKKIVGMILAQYFKPLPISKYSRKGYISNLYILKEYRKKGLGGKLIETALDWLKNNKTKHVSLEIHVDNKKALQLYRKFGFKDYTVKLSKEL
ncbi:GNAT family N-acetyltransferase [Candidatus Woesearchaeota archaeon]|nr:GNAT family N-acetyltransferase [Candidatus Woesearchaeota archaeon]